jgi:prolyl oligopeptidase
LLWFIARPAGGKVAMTLLARQSDRVRDVAVAKDGSLFFLSDREAPHGRVLHLPAGATQLSQARVVIAESDRHLTDLEVTASTLFVFDIRRAASHLRTFDLAGRERGEVSTPAHFTVSPAGVLGDALLVSGESYVDPPALYRVDEKARSLVRTAFATTSTTRFDDLEVLDESARSKDGTEVPITLLVSKAARGHGPTPLYLAGYGGYGVSLPPEFSVTRRALLDLGFTLGIVHLRGGGDLGEPWHQQGMLSRKQNVFDDFIASADALVAKGYTTRDKLAIRGASNGGLLMGAVLNQRPDLARAAVIGVPMMDMVHLKAVPNGVYNTTEFGDPDRAEDFRFILPYSPCQNITKAAYPAVLVTSGAKDGRVPPGDARRYTAKLQASSTSSRPVLLRTWWNAGHGIGTPMSARSEELAEIYAFLLEELGVPYSPAKGD